MELTAAQEEQLINQYDKLLWSIVYRFKRRKGNEYRNDEDLHSECVIVFLRHIRSCDNMEDVRKVPIRDMINAMCYFVLGEQAVAYPKRTADFRRVMENAVRKVDYSAVDSYKDTWCEPFGDLIDRITFREFLQSLSDKDREIVIMKLQGVRNGKIARKFGVSDATMTRMIKRLKEIYVAHAA